MLKKLLLLIITTGIVTAYSQTYSPITVTGFNHDVIAEGSVNSSEATTTKEMDALVPSNNVICTEQFAAFNGLPLGYGIPNNGFISSGNKDFQLAPLGDGSAIAENVLYLLKGESGTLTLSTPGTFTSLSFLVTSTESGATLDINVHYTDGTNQVFPGNTVLDWVGTSAAVISGFGRIKRIPGPFTTGTYEMSPVNPKLYSLEIAVPCSKTVSSIDFNNVSSGTNTGANRAFIFAVSGITAISPTAPVLADATICYGQSATLSVQSPDPALSYRWYSVATGGGAIAIGTTYTTPALTANTTYYVQSGNTSGCTSSRTPVNVTVSPQVDVPLAASAQVCQGQSATLSVTNPLTGISYIWYSSQTGGTALDTTTVFTTPVINANTTFYLEAVNAAGCKSTSRTAVNVTISPAAAAPSASATPICPGQSASLSVTNIDPALTYSWFTSSAGGTPFATGTTITTGPLTTATTFYVQASVNGSCASTLTAVTVSMLPAATAPAVSGVSVCSGQPATLSVSNIDPALTYSWFISSTGGTPFATGTSITTGPITSATTYYVQSSGTGSCASALTPVSISILPSLVSPTANAPNVCAGQTGTISITNIDPLATYNWFTTSTGGTSIFTGTTFTTPAVTTAITYYIEASNVGGCISARTPVTINAYPAVADPIATADNVCTGQQGIITVSNPDPALTYSYYTTSSGGTAVATGTTYTTPPLTGTTTYYVEATNAGGCKSANRTPVVISINTALAAPVVTATDVTASSVTFSWSAISGATSYQVSVNGSTYAAPSSGSAGTSHTITGLASGQQVNIAVIALGGTTCSTSPAGAAKATTLSTDIYIPNVFTPNADGKNDVFYVYGNDIASMNLKIFNQWGEMIFESKDNTKGWDGISKGKAQPTGVYVFAVNVTLKNGSVISKKGSISLIR